MPQSVFLTNYDIFRWSFWADSNRRPSDYESLALPAEPQKQDIGLFVARDRAHAWLTCAAESCKVARLRNHSFYILL